MTLTLTSLTLNLTFNALNFPGTVPLLVFESHSDPIHSLRCGGTSMASCWEHYLTSLRAVFSLGKLCLL